MEETTASHLDFHLDPHLYEGRPQDVSGRLGKELRTYDLLDTLGIAYQRVDHGPVDTIECCGDIENLLGLMNDREGRVRLLSDRDVAERQEYIGCHPCINTPSLRIRTADILDKFLPHVRHGYTLVDLPFIE